MGNTMSWTGRLLTGYMDFATYDYFSDGEIKAANVAMFAVDVTMDATLSPISYYYTGNISNGYLRSSINGILDAVVDIFQTLAYFTQ